MLPLTATVVELLPVPVRAESRDHRTRAWYTPAWSTSWHGTGVSAAALTRLERLDAIC